MLSRLCAIAALGGFVIGCATCMAFSASVEGRTPGSAAPDLASRVESLEHDLRGKDLRIEFLTGKLDAYQRADAGMGKATAKAIDRSEELAGLLKVANKRLGDAGLPPVPDFRFLLPEADKALAAPPKF